MSVRPDNHRAFLLRIARQALAEAGLLADFSPEAMAETQSLHGPAPVPSGTPDLRKLPWCSIDNDDSRDLDQLTVAIPSDQGGARLLVAVADVSALVPRGSALDDHASTNTTSVYTPPQVFPMLPERLSTDLTSLNENQDRLAVVLDVAVTSEGETGKFDVYEAAVHNYAKLAYSSVGAWLEGSTPAPPGIDRVEGLSANLKLQDHYAQLLRQRRHEHGALDLETIEVHALFDGDAIRELTAETRNCAKELIENFMIAGNGVMAEFLTNRKFPVVRRVVRSPERWPRIVALALEYGEHLPPEPNAPALNAFLIKRRDADPVRFPDLSLSIIKLLGRGEYVASFPGEAVIGHFGLAVKEYTHSTAPNRRYPDLLTQRLLKAALAGGEIPYTRDQLSAMATHFTQKEDAAEKVERFMRKVAAACWLSNRIGSSFEGIVTGASEKGTWVRVFNPPVEGRVVQGWEGLDVGDHVNVTLTRTDPEHGFIDFKREGHGFGRGPRASKPH